MGLSRLYDLYDPESFRVPSQVSLLSKTSQNPNDPKRNPLQPREKFWCVSPYRIPPFLIYFKKVVWKTPDKVLWRQFIGRPYDIFFFPFIPFDSFFVFFVASFFFAFQGFFLALPVFTKSIVLLIRPFRTLTHTLRDILNSSLETSSPFGN